MTTNDPPIAGDPVDKTPPVDVSKHTQEPRRDFLKEVATVVIGAIATLVPLIAGFLFFLDPVRGNRFVPRSRRKRSGGGNTDEKVYVTTLQALPEDGQPQKFTVVDDQADAWNFYPDQRVGNVYLRKVSPEQVIAFSEICPHLGCSVEYKPGAPADHAFRCPCHASAFSLTGEKSNSIPPRDLDQLETEIRNGDEVWVHYQKFRIATEEKTAIS